MSICICGQARTYHQPSGRSTQEEWRVATSMTGPGDFTWREYIGGEKKWLNIQNYLRIRYEVPPLTFS